MGVVPVVVIGINKGVYRKRKCTFSQKHTIFITKIQVYMFLLFVACFNLGIAREMGFPHLLLQR